MTRAGHALVWLTPPEWSGGTTQGDAHERKERQQESDGEEAHKSGDALTKQTLATIDQNLARIDAAESGTAPAATTPEALAVENAKPAKGKKDKTKPAGAKPTTSAKHPKTPKPAKEPKPKKMSALDAAAKILGDEDKTGEGMRAPDLIEAMSAKGLWNSPGGKTPHATLYAAMIREIQMKGKDARFKKLDRGLFASTAAK
jgi:hypothetical protein